MALVAQGCSPADITALVKTILPGPLGTLVALRLAALDHDRRGGRIERARKTMFEIVDLLVKAWDGGLFADDPVKRGKLEALIKLLFCLVGLPQPPIDLGPDGGAAVVTPTSPPTVVQTGNLRAATQIGTGAVPQTVLITITKLAATGGWLDTQLDQYGPGYEFSVVPAVQFTTDVLAGACINGTGNEALDMRLRLAHDNPSGTLGTGNARFGNIEIISETPFELVPLGLECAPQINFFERMFLPQKLYAVGSPATTGGKVRNYSPFAAVDPLLTVSANSVTSQSGTAGAPVGDPPSVTVQTRNQISSESSNGVSGVSIAFQPDEGSGSVTDGAQVTSTSAGVATVGSWTLAGTPGDNALEATASAPGLSFTGSPVTFTATGVSPATPLTYGADDWRYTTATPEGDFTAPGFDDSDWSVGSASFGFNNLSDECAQYADIKTPWAVNTTMYLRRQFLVPEGVTSGYIQVAIDNDVTVWVNGTNVSGNPTTHEGCANQGDFFFFTNVNPGVNTIVVKATDRGSSSYFDAAFSQGD
jgi:hypothetical protein